MMRRPDGAAHREAAMAAVAASIPTVTEFGQEAAGRSVGGHGMLHLEGRT
jgi:hypothetical protein